MSVIREKRKRLAITQTQLAQEIGAAQSEISDMERGKIGLTQAMIDWLGEDYVPETNEPPSAQESPNGDTPPEARRENEKRQERIRVKDSAPTPPLERVRQKPSNVPKAEIDAIERGLLELLAGIPFETLGPDGETYTAVIPGVAQAVGMFDEYDGRIIEAYAPSVAKAWADLAAENAAVRRVLLGITFGGPYRGVVASMTPMLFAIAMHHQIGPFAPRPQFVEPEAEAESEAPEFNPADPSTYGDGRGFGGIPTA